jgi:hypothetical protein
MTEKPVRQLKLKIADFVIQAQCANDDTGLAVPQGSKEFLIEEGKPDCVISAHYGPLPKVQLDRLIFEVEGSAWNLYSSGEKLVFQLFGVDNTRTKTFTHAMAIFEPDFSKGDLFICPSTLLPVQESIPPEKEKLALNPYAYPLDELLVVNLLALKKGVHVHALGIIHKGQGLVFCGVSGAGKSTLAELWKKQNVKILSDDRISLRRQDGRIWAYGTPWHGDARTHLAAKEPLQAIYFIKHGKENRIVPLSKSDAVTRLLVRCFPTFYIKEGMENTLAFISELADDVPCFELQFTPDQRAIDEVLHHADGLASQKK